MYVLAKAPYYRQSLRLIESIKIANSMTFLNEEWKEIEAPDNTVTCIHSLVEFDEDYEDKDEPENYIIDTIKIKYHDLLT